MIDIFKILNPAMEDIMVGVLVNPDKKRTKKGYKIMFNQSLQRNREYYKELKILSIKQVLISSGSGNGTINCFYNKK